MKRLHFRTLVLVALTVIATAGLAIAAVRVWSVIEAGTDLVAILAR